MTKDQFYAIRERERLAQIGREQECAEFYAQKRQQVERINAPIAAVAYVHDDDERVAEHRPVSAAPSGAKADTGKAPWHLLPFDALAEVVAVLQFGAQKYGARNWEHGIAHSRTYAATLRHLTAWWQGEDRDPETGLSHLAHAACETLFALAFECRGGHRRRDLDDRPNPKAYTDRKDAP